MEDMNINEKMVSLGYAILKMIEWDIQRTDKKEKDIKITLEKFNDQNNFGKNKLRLLPHFLCTTNPNREAMFSIFNSFYATPDLGYTENDVDEYLENDLADVRGFSVFFTPSDDKIDLNVEQISKIFSPNFEIDDNHFVHVVCQEENNTNFFSALNLISTKGVLNEILESVLSFKRQDYFHVGGIVSMSSQILSKLSKEQLFYKLYSDQVLSYKLGSNRKQQIDIKFLQEENTIFSDSPKKKLGVAVFDM